MKILNPTENINRIISLVENAKKFLVIVSPYTNMEGWDQLKEAINKASGIGVVVSYYVRGGEGKKGLEGLNVNVFEVPMLHAKMFFSEGEAITSSSHLMYNKDINWACALDFPEEYNELVHFFETSIKLAVSVN